MLDRWQKEEIKVNIQYLVSKILHENSKNDEEYFLNLLYSLDLINNCLHQFNYEEIKKTIDKK